MLENERRTKRQIRDAKFRSDFVFLNIHSHEGINANWYDDEPADFFVETAHAAIDAGADVVIGHGAHFMRGVETYQGKTIFYNLGSLMMEFESGNSIIPPEMYAEYGLDEHAKPSQLHRQRSVDDDGNFIGFNAYSKFSQNIILEVDINEGQNCKIKVVPIDLDLTNRNPIKRGLPNIPNNESAKLILKRLNKISQPFNTKFLYDEINNNFSTIQSY
ncbi:CapA family protein [Pediococcus pentosaceus]